MCTVKSNSWGSELNEFADLIKKVDRHETDLYFGEGKDNPSVTTRLALIENSQERLERMTSEKFEKWDRLLTKLVWGGAALAASVIGQLLKAIFFPHLGQ